MFTFWMLLWVLTHNGLQLKGKEASFFPFCSEPHALLARNHINLWAYVYLLWQMCLGHPLLCTGLQWPHHAGMITSGCVWELKLGLTCLCEVAVTLFSVGSLPWPIGCPDPNPSRSMCIDKCMALSILLKTEFRLSGELMPNSDQPSLPQPARQNKHVLFFFYIPIYSVVQWKDVFHWDVPS